MTTADAKQPANLSRLFCAGVLHRLLEQDGADGNSNKMPRKWLSIRGAFMLVIFGVVWLFEMRGLVQNFGRTNMYQEGNSVVWSS
jgi:hypothetical protein